MKKRTLFALCFAFALSAPFAQPQLATAEEGHKDPSIADRFSSDPMPEEHEEASLKDRFSTKPMENNALKPKKEPGFFDRFFGGSHEDEDMRERQEREEEEAEQRLGGMLPVQKGVYSEECGSCHFAFQADLLPERSWKKLLGDLQHHFGEDATLEGAHLEEVTTYLTTNAGDHSKSPRVSRMMSSINKETPIKVTDIPYFKKEHSRVKASTIKREAIHSLSNCSACHTTAAEGEFGEDGIRIPR